MRETPSVVDPILLQRLGLIVIQSAQIEARMGETLSRLLKADQVPMYLITQTISSATQAGWVRALVDLRLDESPGRDRIMDLLNEIDELRAERNMLAHGLWGAGSQPLTAIVQTAKLDRPAVLQTQLVTLADLDDLTARLQAAIKNMAELQVALNHALARRKTN